MATYRSVDNTTKRKDEPNYSAGESYEGTSLLSSNPSILSSTASFVSSVSSDGSLPFSLSHSNLLSYSASRTRTPARLRHNSSSGSLKRTASLTPQEADDLEQTFRLRMMLYPDEATTAVNASSSRVR